MLRTTRPFPSGIDRFRGLSRPLCTGDPSAARTGSKPACTLLMVLWPGRCRPCAVQCSLTPRSARLEAALRGRSLPLPQHQSGKPETRWVNHLAAVTVPMPFLGEVAYEIG